MLSTEGVDLDVTYIFMAPGTSLRASWAYRLTVTYTLNVKPPKKNHQDAFITHTFNQPLIKRVQGKNKSNTSITTVCMCVYERSCFLLRQLWKTKINVYLNTNLTLVSTMLIYVITANFTTAFFHIRESGIITSTLPCGPTILYDEWNLSARSDFWEMWSVSRRLETQTGNQYSHSIPITAHTSPSDTGSHLVHG